MSSSNTAAEAEPVSQGAEPFARWCALGAAVLVILVVYAVWPYQHWQFSSEARGSVLGGWVRVLRIDPEWYFCFLVPPIVAFLVYRIRAELAALPLRGTWWGVLPAVVAFAFFWMGYKLDTGYLGYASIQLLVAALILLLGGPAWMRALFLPWIFLVFAWPMYPLESIIASPLRVFTAKVASTVLNLVGVPVVRVGTALHSAADAAGSFQEGDRFKLDVANPCSGIRSLFSLMMISVLWGFIAMKRTWPRLALFASSLPLAVAGNLVRLLLLALGCVWFGQDFAIGTNDGQFQTESFYHEICGYVVFAVALSGMFGLSSWFEGRRHWKKVNLWDAGGRRTTAVNQEHAGDSPMLVVHAGVCIALAAAGLTLCVITPTATKIAEPGIVLNLPAIVGNYVGGKELEMFAEEKKLFDEGVSLRRRSYLLSANRGFMVTLVLGGPVKKSLHEPSVCLPDQGWQIADTEVVTLDADDGRKIGATIMHVFKDRVTSDGRRVRLRSLNLYWYQGSHGVSTPSFNMSYARTYIDAIFRNLNHRWGQVAIWMPVSERLIGFDDPLEEEIARTDLMEFAGKLAPHVLAKAD